MAVNFNIFFCFRLSLLSTSKSKDLQLFVAMQIWNHHIWYEFRLRIFCVNNNNNNKNGQKDDVIVVQVLIGRLCNHLAYLFMSSIRNFYFIFFFRMDQGSQSSTKIKQVDIIGIFLWVVTRSDRKKKLLQKEMYVSTHNEIFFFSLLRLCLWSLIRYWSCSKLSIQTEREIIKCSFQYDVVNVCVGTNQCISSV